MSRFGSQFTQRVSPGSDAARPKPAAAGRGGFQPSMPSDTVELVGYLQNVRIFNEWATGKFEVYADGNKHNTILTIKGQVVADLQADTEYRLIGRMTNHQKYGPALDVISSAPHVQLDPKAIQKYLVNNFKGIGEKSAKKIVDNVLKSGGNSALETFRNQILNEPWAVDWSMAGREGVFDGGEDDGVGYISRDLATRLGNIKGINSRVLVALSSWLYGQRTEIPAALRTNNPVFDAWKIYCEDPYEPIQHVLGYGFNMADAAASMVGMDKNCPQRLRALVYFALEDTCNSSGHVFLDDSQLVEAIRRIDPRVDADSAIDHCVQDALILAEDSSNGARYYTPKLNEAEVVVAERISELLAPSAPLYKGSLSEADIQTGFRTGKENASALSLDASQVEAIRSILTNKSRIHVLTGGPGCGKTALIETIVRLLPKKQFQFCAPTGKAAKVLTSRIHATGHGATTIHSLFGGSESGWRVNAEEPLNGDVLVVDEASMPSLELWDAVLNGMAGSMHLIVVGDQNQLPSIQAGMVLSDLLKLQGINHVHLNQVHRNSGGILDIVREVTAGNLSPTDRESVRFSHGLGDASVEFSSVVEHYLASVRRSGVENTLLLMSRRQGKEDEPGWNTTYANAILREVCNPNAQRLPGTKLHINDRILIRQNMSLVQKSLSKDDDEREERVVNGDTGTISGFEEFRNGNQTGIGWLTLKLDDGRTIDYPGDRVNVLQHAYALTVHAAQGSEYREIVAVFTPGMPGFVNRNMLMTGLSRARSALTVFAEDAVLRSIAKTPLPTRNSALAERIESDSSEEESPVLSASLCRIAA